MASLLVTLMISLSVIPALFPRTNQATKSMSVMDHTTKGLFIGTSHVYASVRPDLYSDDVVTLTAPVLNYQLMHKVLENELHRLIGLKYVVLEYDVLPLIYDTLKIYDGRNAPLRDIGLPYDDRGSKLSERVAELVARTVLRPIYYESHRANVLALKRRFQVVAGYEPSTLTVGREPDLRQLQAHISDTKHTSSVANERALFKAMELILARNLQLILIRYPYHPSYVRNSPPEWENSYQSLLVRIRQRLGNRLTRVVDLRDLAVLDLDKDFRNLDHLNDHGAKKVGILLNEILESLNKAHTGRAGD